jgi:uncharacterized membrane protein
MITKLHHWWEEMRCSFWFIPAMNVLGGAGLAVILIAVDINFELHLDKKWPLIFGSGAAGARGLLSTVAGSMITVAGVVFSITIVALTTSQYTSRVLRNFMRDRFTQLVLGVFVGIFAYCLVVLRTIRGGDEGAFVPSLAVLGGLVLAFVGIAFLIFFIHHISISIQASNIIAIAAEETITAVDQLFPKGLGEGHEDDDGEDNHILSLAEQSWSAVLALKTGYIENCDGNALLDMARKRGTILRMERGIGEFVADGDTLVSVASPVGFDEEATAKLNAAYVISRQRTVQQDAGFGIRQIVDIAMKALSPGINDSTTAVMCVDYLGAILKRLAPREIVSPYRLDGGTLRLITRGYSFESLLAEAFDQIRENAEGNFAVLNRQLQALKTIGAKTSSPRRRQVLRQQEEQIGEAIKRSTMTQSSLNK